MYAYLHKNAAGCKHSIWCKRLCIKHSMCHNCDACGHVVLCQHSPSSSAALAHILVLWVQEVNGLQRVELYSELLSMFQEKRRTQILGEHIHNVLHRGNGEYLNFTFFDLLSDVMIADLNMLNPFLCYGILSVEDRSMAVTINRDIWHGFSEFAE